MSRFTVQSHEQFHDPAWISADDWAGPGWYDVQTFSSKAAAEKLRSKIKRDDDEALVRIREHASGRDLSRRRKVKRKGSRDESDTSVIRSTLAKADRHLSRAQDDLGTLLTAVRRGTRAYDIADKAWSSLEQIRRSFRSKRKG